MLMSLSPVTGPSAELRDGHAPDDPRIGPSATFGKDWLPGVYEWQLRQLAMNREHDGTPG